MNCQNVSAKLGNSSSDCITLLEHRNEGGWGKLRQGEDPLSDHLTKLEQAPRIGSIERKKENNRPKKISSVNARAIG